MSTTSTVITIIICVFLVAAIGFALIKGIWSAAKKITVPIQIVLFGVMLVCVFRLFCTKENAKKLYEGIEQTGISQNVENTMRSALNLKSAEVAATEPEAVGKDSAVVVPKPAATPAVAPAATPAPAPVESPVAKVETEQVVEEEPAPVKVPDYSSLDKGKKTFTYALPFDAKVTVGFKDNTYRVIAETLGSLDADEKKEVGQLIKTSLGKYIGKTIDSWDKSKISLEARYDEAEERTRVFAIVPPEAIN